MIETINGRTGVRRMVAVLFPASLAAIMAAFAATASAPPAEAHDHRIPKTVLEKGTRDLQGGLLVAESFWSRSAGGDRCKGAFTDYAFRYPEADRVAAGSALHVRVFKTQRPTPSPSARTGRLTRTASLWASPRPCAGP